MPVRRLIPAFLFGFAFQLTLVAMSLASFGASATRFEILVPRFADIVSWMILPACVVAVLIYTGILQKSGCRTASRAEQRAWIVAFMCGITIGMAATSMGLAGGFWGPVTRWQRLLRQASTAVVLVLAYGGAAFALIDAVSSWRVPRDSGREKVNRIIARLILAAVLLLYGTGNALVAWASGAAFVTFVMLLTCIGSAFDLLTN
jgi:hypothetical protein